MEDPYDPTREFVGPLPEPDGADQSTIDAAYSDDVDEADVRSQEEIEERIDDMTSYFQEYDRIPDSKAALEDVIVDHLAAGQGIDPDEFGGAEYLADRIWERTH